MTPADSDPTRRTVNPPEYEYRRESPKAFGSAVFAVERAIEDNGFVVRVMHDIQATLAAKGFRVDPIRIYEIDATPELVEELSPGVALALVDRLMPCRINVFVDADHTAITGLRPTLMCRMFPEEPLEELAQALEDAVTHIVDDASD